MVEYVAEQAEGWGVRVCRSVLHSEDVDSCTANARARSALC